MIATMNDNNKPLKIPKNKRWKGMTVYCYHCKRNVSEICKESSGNSLPLHQCKHGEKHIFKQYVGISGAENERRTKNLGRDLNSAVKMAMEFENDVKENKGAKQNEKLKQIEPLVEQPIPQLLKGAMARYVGHLSNDPEIVAKFRMKGRTKKHLEDVARNFKYFLHSTMRAGYNTNLVQVNEINDTIIEKFLDYLKEGRKLGNNSINRAIAIFSAFFNFLIHKGCPIKNPFRGITRKPIVTNIETISESEWLKLMEIVQKSELGNQTLSSGRVQNYYKPWLKNSIKYGLFSGRRTSELILSLWSDIRYDEKNNPSYIRVPDYKVNRQKGNEGTNLKYIEIPIIEELLETLKAMGLDKYGGSDKYIIAPEEDMTRDSVKSFLGHAFTHYFRQLGTGRTVSFKSLRKTYISHLTGYLGINNARLITKHADTKVMEQSYIDMKFIATTAKGFKMFDHEANRRKEEITKSRSSNNEISIER